MTELWMQNKAKNLAFKDIKEGSKLLLKDIDIADINIREYIWYEQEWIVWRRQKQQPSSITCNLFE